MYLGLGARVSHPEREPALSRTARDSRGDDGARGRWRTSDSPKAVRADLFTRESRFIKAIGIDEKIAPIERYHAANAGE